MKNLGILEHQIHYATKKRVTHFLKRSARVYKRSPICIKFSYLVYY